MVGVIPVSMINHAFCSTGLAVYKARLSHWMHPIPVTSGKIHMPSAPRTKPVTKAFQSGVVICCAPRLLWYRFTKRFCASDADGARFRPFG
jgi:hypothetical protein